MNTNELHSVLKLSVWDILITFEDMKPTGLLATRAEFGLTLVKCVFPSTTQLRTLWNIVLYHCTTTSTTEVHTTLMKKKNKELTTVRLCSKQVEVLN